MQQVDDACCSDTASCGHYPCQVLATQGREPTEILLPLSSVRFSGLLCAALVTVVALKLPGHQCMAPPARRHMLATDQATVRKQSKSSGELTAAQSRLSKVKISLHVRIHWTPLRTLPVSLPLDATSQGCRPACQTGAGGPCLAHEWR